mgnify:CR=1 FL=1
MKKRIVAIIFSLILLANISGFAFARASEYFGYTAVYAFAKDDGEILIEYDIDPTHKMLECGARVIWIYEEQSNGKFEDVFTYHMDDYPEMIQHNTIIGDGEVTYQGTPGLQYYALVGVYAKDANGSETMYFYTNVVTARN